MFDYRMEAGDPASLGVTKNGRDINFAVAVQDKKECSLLLYPRGSKEPAEELVFEDRMRFGDIYAMKLKGFPADEYEYNYRIDKDVVQDPYARAVRGREVWGAVPEGSHDIRCGICQEHFSWQKDQPLMLPYEECVLYVTHVRGFTMDPSSKVKHPGTFAGVREKISYLKKLGITQLELMPIYEFPEVEADETPKKHKPFIKKKKMNYWGYKKAEYFAPKSSYSAAGDPVRELKELVRELHKNGIELILEFYFPFGTNQSMIVDCIRYWAKEYHIDGVHVNSDNVPLALIAQDPYLSQIKIMSEYFPADRIYPYGYEPSRRRLAEYNDDFLVKARRFLRGDEDTLGSMALSIRKNPGQFAVINYMACHNGFTLADMVSYDAKHNEANGDNNQDGSDYNYSSNYGEEGMSTGKGINKLRRRQIRNAFLLVLLSQGVPAIYGGDEMGNSQQGNNNVYCQDNEISWVQWPRRKADRRLLKFVQEAIAFRKASPAFGRRKEYVMKDHLSKGIPDLSYHGKKAWYEEFENYNHQMGILYAGEYTGGETCYVLYNMHMVGHEMALPILPKGFRWYVTADTIREDNVFYPSGEEPVLEEQKTIEVEPHTIMILAGKKYEID